MVDQAKQAWNPKENSFGARSRTSSHAHAKIITGVEPECPKSAQPSTNVWGMRRTNSNIDGLPKHDPPKDPWFATRLIPCISFPHKILWDNSAVLLRVLFWSNTRNSQPWPFAVAHPSLHGRQPLQREAEYTDGFQLVEGQSPPVDMRKMQSPDLHPRFESLARQLDLEIAKWR